MQTSSNIIINEYIENEKIVTFNDSILMNKFTYNKLYKQLENKPKFIVTLLYNIDDILTGLYFKTNIKLFEAIGAYIGGLGNKLNKEE
jgi:hypothetical protein